MPSVQARSVPSARARWIRCAPEWPYDNTMTGAARLSDVPGKCPAARGAAPGPGASVLHGMTDYQLAMPSRPARMLSRISAVTGPASASSQYRS